MLGAATSAARSVLGLLGGAEQHVEELEQPLHETVTALHRAAESLDHHVEILEGLAESLPELTVAITRLCDQLAAALALAAPVEVVEREVSGLGRLLHRRRRRSVAAAGHGLPVATPPPSVPPAESGSAPR